MLFNWDTNNLCIVFSQWHIRTTAGLFFSLIAVILIGMGYEALRAGTRRYETIMNKRMESIPSEPSPPPSFLTIPRKPYNLFLVWFAWLRERKKERKQFVVDGSFL